MILQFISLTLILFIVQSRQFKKHQHQVKVEEDEQQQHNDITSCVNPGPLPGIDQLGLGNDLLYFDNKVNLFEFTCFGRNYSLDGQSQVPDGVAYSPLLLLNQQTHPETAQSWKEFQEVKLKTFGTTVDNENDKQKKIQYIAGALNQNILKIQKEVQNNQNLYQHITTSYTNQNAWIDDYTRVQLKQEVIDAIKKLPVKYDYSAYKDFIVKYGTHYRYSIHLGGLIEQNGFTNSNYANQNTLKSMNEEFLVYFVKEELAKDFPTGHILRKYAEQQANQEYLDNTNFGPLLIRGGDKDDLREWAKSTETNPAVIHQYLKNITNIMTEQYFPNFPNLQPIKTNTGKALETYLIYSQGCTNPKAMNYNKDAQVDDGTCYYTTFDGFYQTANSDECTQDQTDSYQINNPTNDKLECDSNQISEKIATYNYDNCKMEQYFCLRNDPISQDKSELKQSLQICEGRSTSDVFFKTENQYQCNDSSLTEDSLYFNIKNENTCSISTCQQSFCYDKQEYGVQGFINQHQGNCIGVKINQNQEDLSQFCQDSCLIQYGKVQIADDCDVYQYICIKRSENLPCTN